MHIDRLLYPIESLGPGRRLVIWTAGCSKRCAYCSNPELWEADEAGSISVETLYEMVEGVYSRHAVDGITITGGDPLEQLDELLELVKRLKALCEDILVYTGFTIKELKQKLSPEQMAELMENVGVLIDGKYIHALNHSTAALRGSVNQKLFFFDEKLRERYGRYMSGGRTIKNVFYKNSIISVGIHNRRKTK